MKSLKSLASVVVLLGLTIWAPNVNAQIKPQQNQPAQNNQKAETKLERGLKLFQAEKYREAIDILSQVITEEPNNQYAYVARGGSYLGLNDYQKAKADLDKSISLDSNISFAYLFRGLSNYGLGSKQEAISDLQTAANLFEKDGDKDLSQKALDAIKRIQNA